MSDVSPNGQDQVEIGQSLDDPIPGEENLSVQDAVDNIPAGQESEPFLAVDVDGQELKFNSKDEAVKYLKDGTLRHSAFTKKTQEVAEQRKALEQKEKDLEAQMNEFFRHKSEYDKMNDFLKQRPDVKARILTEMKSPHPNAQYDQVKSYTDERTKEIEQKLNEFKESMEAEAKAKQYEEQKRKVFNDLKSSHEDFDEKVITEMLEEIEGYQSLPPEQAMRNFSELLYYAKKGMSSGQSNGQNGGQPPKPKRVTVPMGAQARAPVTAGTAEGDFDAIAAIAKQEMGAL